MKMSGGSGALAATPGRSFASKHTRGDGASRTAHRAEAALLPTGFHCGFWMIPLAMKAKWYQNTSCESLAPMGMKAVEETDPPLEKGGGAQRRRDLSILHNPNPPFSPFFKGGKEPQRMVCFLGNDGVGGGREISGLRRGHLLQAMWASSRNQRASAEADKQVNPLRCTPGQLR